MADFAGSRVSSLLSIAPGLALALTIALGAVAFSKVVGFQAASPLVIAIILGIIVRHTVGVPSAAGPGLVFSQKLLLRAAIVLLGLQITLDQIVQLGLGGIVILVLVVGASFGFTLLLGRLLGIDRKLVQLIAVGTAICGASAIAATNAVTRDSEDSVAYSIACITLFGTLSLLVYPTVAALAGLPQDAYGFWAGASLHEVGQVLAAADPHDPGNDVALLAKLARVLMLVPMVLMLGYLSAREGNGGATLGRVSVPWFICGFALMSLVASTKLVPAGIIAPLNLLSQTLLAMALAAMGLASDLRHLAARGVRPILLGGASTVFIAAFSFALVALAFGH